MKVIRFKTEGILNSFRIPFFRTYHKSFLAPPKTTIIGMLTNILAKPEKWFYDVLDKDIIDVSVVIDNIQGKAKDLWSYKTFENKSDMHGRSIIRRDKLLYTKYTIYLYVKDEKIHDEIFEALNSPKNIPSLGLDDEIIKISNIEELYMVTSNSKSINSVFIDYGFKYSVNVTDLEKFIELPVSNIVPTKFIVTEEKDVKRSFRKVEKEVNQVEFLNCEIQFEEKFEKYTDGINKVVFY